MHPTKSLLTLATVLFAFATAAMAQTVNTHATVARVTGTATVTLADGTTSPLTTGMKLPQGATITTGADGDVYLETHTGYVTSIKAESVVTVDEVSVVSENGKVTEERTMLDLKSGNLVANLDPKKKAINNYQVRTPKGVAAARGTTFVIQYKGQTVRVAVVNGVVTMNELDVFGQTSRSLSELATASSDNSISAGSHLTTAIFMYRKGSLVATQATFAKSSQDDSNEINELLAAVVASVAVAAQSGMGGATAADAAAVAAAVFAEVPGVAAQAAAIMSKSGVTTGAVAEAVKATVPTGQRDAFDTSLQTGTFQKTTVNVQARTRGQTTTEATPIMPVDVRVVSPN